ncbi:MAG: DUF924 domain-containing protein [Rhodospirillaceae bacterium]|jgi:uncharacterized protein (DUF924 family)|nr:DUF924 domain-containing protein [Rhodospirillaceae bacterium]MBT5666111.1 DUF924 domain-containing protein [Rhodospirillaceae bacterium]MBT5811223.1 DUF924 domain-containing protein [Rhodospirillaceae bacterium]
MSTETIAEIIAFWLGSSLEGPEAAFARRDWWYKGGPAVDEDIRMRFGALVPQACEGGLVEWRNTADGAFALILLLDQFTRNLYRFSPDAYAGDAHAFEVVNQVVEQKLDRELPPVSRIWLYHPFHHSEQIEEQDRGLALLDSVRDAAPEVWRPYVQRSIKGWTRHRDIVARFGRFPHRNTVLGRTSTDDERAFLAADGDAFGQGPKEAAASSPNSD